MLCLKLVPCVADDCCDSRHVLVATVCSVGPSAADELMCKRAWRRRQHGLRAESTQPSVEAQPTSRVPSPRQVGVKCVVLKGSMSMEQRDRMISAFTEDPDVTVFLMSLKAGGARWPCPRFVPLPLVWRCFRVAMTSCRTW